MPSDALDEPIIAAIQKAAVVWVCAALIAYACITIYLLSDGLGIMAPFAAFFEILFGIIWAIFGFGWITPIWLLLSSTLSIAYFVKGNQVVETFRRTLVATLIGLTPHMAFVAYSSWVGPREFRTSGLAEKLVDNYENLIWGFQDKIGDYLLPSFFTGIAISAALFTISNLLKLNDVLGYWKRINGVFRFCGVFLLSANMFTVFTALPGGDWQPNARSYLSTQIKGEIESRAKLVLYQDVLSDLKSSSSALRQALVQATQTAPSPGVNVRGFLGSVDPMENAEERIRDIAQVVSQKTRLGSGTAKAIVVPRSIERSEARLAAKEITRDTVEIQKQAETTRRQIAEIFGSGIGAVSESLVGKLLSAVIEDAATKLAEFALEKSSGDDGTGWLSSWSDKVKDVDKHCHEAAHRLLGSVRVVLISPGLPSEISAVASERVLEARRAYVQENADRARVRARGFR